MVFLLHRKSTNNLPLGQKQLLKLKNEKEALKKFMEPVLSDPDCDIVFTGALEQVNM